MTTPEVNWFYVWGAIVILVILGICTYTYKEITRAKTKYNRRTQIDKNALLAVLRAQADGALYSLLEAEYADENRAETQDTSDEVAPATRTLMLWTAVLASATILMAYFAYFTLDAIRGQLDVMETDKRPWIRANVSLAAPVRFTDWNGFKGVSIQVKLSLKNYGTSPAINVRAPPRIVVHPGNPRRSELDPIQKKICDDTAADADKNPVGGLAIFPTEEVTSGGWTSISGIYGTGERTLFSVLGCIVYTYADSRHGETGYRFLLGQDINGGVFGLPFKEGVLKPYHDPPSPEMLASGFPAIPPKEATMSLDEVYFSQEDSGNYAK
jgi:hypothetical protein